MTASAAATPRTKCQPPDLHIRCLGILPVCLSPRRSPSHAPYPSASDGRFRNIKFPAASPLPLLPASRPSIEHAHCLFSRLVTTLGSGNITPSSRKSFGRHNVNRFVSARSQQLQEHRRRWEHPGRNARPFGGRTASAACRLHETSRACLSSSGLGSHAQPRASCAGARLGRRDADRRQPVQRRTSMTVTKTNSRRTRARPMRKLISCVRSLSGSRRTASMA